MAHSLSPLLHRAAYAALGLSDWTYDALDIGADDLPVLLAGLGEEWRGFSVTMPCKQAAVDVADVVEPLPGLLHAANTLVRCDAGWRAENTDVGGVGMALQLGRRGPGRSGDDHRCGGDGGRGRGGGVLARGRARRCRRPEPGACRRRSRVLDVLGVPFTVTPLAAAALDSPLVVSTVPIAAQPDLLHLPWRGGHTVLDVLYDPWPTPLAQRVTAVGGRVVGGLDVLFWQATAQVELMTGRPAPDRGDARRPRRCARRPLTRCRRGRARRRRCSAPRSARRGPAAGPAARARLAARDETARRGSGCTRWSSPRCSRVLLAGAALLTGLPPGTVGATPGRPAPAVVLAAVDLAGHRLPDRVTYPAAVVCAAAFRSTRPCSASWGSSSARSPVPRRRSPSPAGRRRAARLRRRWASAT